MSLNYTIKPPHVYKFEVIVQDKVTRYLSTAENGVQGFYDFSIENSHKIYLVCHPADANASVVYVGQTRRSMIERFKGGFGNLDNQDKGFYRWAVENGQYLLFVWDLSNVIKINAQLNCVEAEMAYIVRIFQYAWPIWQRQINFQYELGYGLTIVSNNIAAIMFEQFLREIINLKKGVGVDFLEAELARVSQVIKLTHPDYIHEVMQSLD